MSEGKTTTDHETIQEWTEERDGVPATVKGTAKGKKGKAEEVGILRLDFEPRDEGLEEISWDEFFEKFEKEKLAFLYQEETADGSTSRFHKFVTRPAETKGTAGKNAKTASGKGSSNQTSSKASGKTATGKASGNRASGSKETGTKVTGSKETGGKETGGKASGGKTATSKKAATRAS